MCLILYTDGGFPQFGFDPEAGQLVNWIVMRLTVLLLHLSALQKEILSSIH
jgi:hypothetical protein